MNQISYLCNLHDRYEKAMYSDYKSITAKLAWFSSTRANISCTVAKLAQDAEEGFAGENFSLIKQNIKTVRHLQINLYFPLKFTRLDKPLCIFRYTPTLHFSVVEISHLNLDISHF